MEDRPEYRIKPNAPVLNGGAPKPAHWEDRRPLGMTAVPPEPTVTVSLCLTELDRALALILENIGTLETSIEPILTPATATQTPTPPDRSDYAPSGLAQMLAGQVREAHAAAARLRNIIGRVNL